MNVLVSEHEPDTPRPACIPRLTIFEVLMQNGDEFTNADVAVLSDWAAQKVRETPNPDWKRAYALIREGADLLLRRRARSAEDTSMPRDQQPRQLNHGQWEPQYGAKEIS